MSGRSRAPSEPLTLTWETKSTCSVMFAAATQLRSCISPQAPRTCGRLSAETSVPVWSRSRPTSAPIDSNICRICPCVVRRSCSSRSTSSLTRSMFRAIGSSDRRISSVRLPSSPAAVARSASRCAAASRSTCSETCRSVSPEIAFICAASCSRLPDTRAIFSSVEERSRMAAPAPPASSPSRNMAKVMRRRLPSGADGVHARLQASERGELLARHAVEAERADGPLRPRRGSHGRARPTRS